MQSLLRTAPRHLFFTGKGGVGKTSVACATALGLTERGKRVLLVSTDPASNLAEVLGTPVGPVATPVLGAPGLDAVNLDPHAGAAAYREKLVGPVRGLLPDAVVRGMEEQLSGARSVEIAAFDAFSRLLGDSEATAQYDHVVFDTAPTGHTLRLLALPAAWQHFLAESTGGASCLGPLAGLQSQRSLYEATQAAMANGQSTIVVLVTRQDRSALAEVERTRRELVDLGVQRLHLIVNGVFYASDHQDPVAIAWEATARKAWTQAAAPLLAMSRSMVPLLGYGLVGLAALRTLLGDGALTLPAAELDAVESFPTLDALLPELAATGHGVILTMGKGGVGKTTLAAKIATALANQGHQVRLTTTDPAAHVQAAVAQPVPGLRVDRIDPVAETQAYAAEVLASSGQGLDAAGLALLQEDLRSPCTEEIAVFRAFARAVNEGEAGFVVIDTAPTGHTLLLLDATEACHREVARSVGAIPDAVRSLLPRLRDPAFTRVLIVTLPEATPVHEAALLQADLQRAGIQPFAWLVNQSLRPLAVRDPILAARRRGESRWIAEVQARSTRMAVIGWRPEGQRSDREAAATARPTAP